MLESRQARSECSQGNGYKVWVFYDSSHNQLPTQLFAWVSEIHEGRTHESRPEHNSKVTGIHLVDFLLTLHIVEVLHQVSEGGEVGMRHGGQDLMDTGAL